MAAEAVIDASVVGAALFREAHSAAAIDFLLKADALIAPDLLSAEIASLAAKKVWRGDVALPVAREALRAVGELVETLAPCAPLAPAALEIATAHKLSAYDSLYVALAIDLDLRLVTLDRRLVARVGDAGLKVTMEEPGLA